MGLGTKSRHSQVTSASVLGSVDLSARFVCSAERLDQAVASRKHKFTAEHAEKLMKKHMRKKSSMVTISCVNDRILFTPESGSHSSKSWRTHAKYADIRHIYIYSLNPELFMLCVEDSEHKGKKYYESYRCRTTDDVNRLCELTASAKQTPTNTLPTILPGDTDGDSVLEEDLSYSVEPSMAKAVDQPVLSSNSIYEQDTKQHGMRSSKGYELSPSKVQSNLELYPSSDDFMSPQSKGAFDSGTEPKVQQAQYNYAFVNLSNGSVPLEKKEPKSQQFQQKYEIPNTQDIPSTIAQRKPEDHKSQYNHDIAPLQSKTISVLQSKPGFQPSQYNNAIVDASNRPILSTRAEPEIKRSLSRYVIETAQNEPVLRALPLRTSQTGAVSEPICSPPVVVRDSRRSSQARTNQSLPEVYNEVKDVYRTYRRMNGHSEIDYGPNELRQMFGEDLTCVSTDQTNGAVMCNRGPIYLYASRVTDDVQVYCGDDLVSATNSPRMISEYGW